MPVSNSHECLRRTLEKGKNITIWPRAEWQNRAELCRTKFRTKVREYDQLPSISKPATTELHTKHCDAHAMQLLQMPCCKVRRRFQSQLVVPLVYLKHVATPRYIWRYKRPPARICGCVLTIEATEMPKPRKSNLQVTSIDDGPTPTSNAPCMRLLYSFDSQIPIWQAIPPN